MLKKPNVARHERRSGKTKNLPEWEVPRHDRQDWSDRQKSHIAFGPFHRDRFVSEKSLRVLRVIATPPRALLYLSDRRLKRLSHLKGHGACPAVLFPIENIRCAEQHCRPFLEARFAIRPEGLSR